MEIEHMFKSNPTIQAMKRDIEYMQKTILDLEAKVEDLEERIQREKEVDNEK
jgi:hypothetical protein